LKDLNTTLVDWENLKSDLPYKSIPYSKKNWGSALHSICSYQGKLKPSIAYHLVKTFSKEGDVILDPFSGSGTIALEASLNARKSISFDISKLSFILTKAKTNYSDLNKIYKVVEDLESFIKTSNIDSKYLKKASEFGFNGKVSNYYHKKTFNEILLARRYFINEKFDDPEKAFVMSCLLHILHGNRPYALSRNSHPLTPYAPTGETVYKNLVEKLVQKIERTYKDSFPETFVSGQAFMQDVTKKFPKGLAKVDTVITSPPFFSSTKFYMTNWLRFWFVGWEKEDFEIESVKFLEKKQLVSLNVYIDILNNLHQAIKEGGFVVMHLGKNKKLDMMLELSKIIPNNFKILDQFTEDVSDSNLHGIKDKGSTAEHQYLILQKK